MDNSFKISVIIIAAGKGKRFGLPKWQAEYKGVTFLERIINTLQEAGLRNITCVYREDSKPEITEVNYVLNDHPDIGMFSSVYFGVKSLTETDGVLIWPVDHPFILSETIKELTRSFKICPDCVVKPSFNRKGGHPLIIPWSLAKRIEYYDYPGGLRRLISESSFPIRYSEVSDANILININKIEDLNIGRI